MADPNANLMPANARVWVLKNIDTHPRTKFPYILVPEDEPDGDLEMYLRSLPEPGPHLVGDRFGITNNTIYVLA
jgi:hypothetical protein